MDVDGLIKAVEVGELDHTQKIEITRILKQFRDKKFNVVVEMSQENFKRYYTEILEKTPLN